MRWNDENTIANLSGLIGALIVAGLIVFFGIRFGYLEKETEVVRETRDYSEQFRIDAAKIDADIDRRIEEREERDREFKKWMKDYYDSHPSSTTVDGDLDKAD